MPDRANIEVVGPVKFRGHLGDGKNLSGAGLVGDLLMVAGDEHDRVQVMQRQGDNYELLPGRDVLLNDSGQEADIEGIACEGTQVYVVGSHAAKRPKLKEALSVDENRSRLQVVEPASPFRSILARFRISPQGVHSQIELTTLRAAIAADPLLRQFAQIPCKENGVDIEGLAVRDGRLRVGFRGPVLQHGWVPVLTCTFASPATSELLFLDLGGLGIRDLERVDGGFLVLAGSVGDIPAPFRLFFWDGTDGLPGEGRPGRPGSLVPLGDIPNPDPDVAKAEGLVVEAETAHHYLVLVLFDGLKDGGATRLRVRKPAS